MPRLEGLAGMYMGDFASTYGLGGALPIKGCASAAILQVAVAVAALAQVSSADLSVVDVVQATAELKPAGDAGSEFTEPEKATQALEDC